MDSYPEKQRNLLNLAPPLRERVTINQLLLRGPELSIRELKLSGEFVQRIHFARGEITILQSSAPEKVEALKQVLIGRGVGLNLVARFGSEELLPSEVSIVQPSDCLQRHGTVLEILRQSGIPADQLPRLLERSGLDEISSAFPDTLSPAEQSVVSFCLSLFLKSKVVLYDQPFRALSSEYSEVLAELMIEMAQSSSRVLLVTGLEKIPETWRLSSCVRLENLDFSFARPRQQSSENLLREVISNVRNMIRETKVIEQTVDFFYTYPQRIPLITAKAVVTEKIRSEQIANPTMANQSTDKGKTRAKEGILESRKEGRKKHDDHKQNEYYWLLGGGFLFLLGLFCLTWAWVM